MNSKLSIKGDISEILYTEKQLKDRIKEMADQIVSDFSESEQPPIFIIVMGGAVHFYSLLVLAIGDRMQLEQDFMALQSYVGDKSSGSAKVLIDLLSSIEDRDIVIVEDIIDTGITMQKILSLLKPRNPHSIKICALLDKAEARTCDDIQIDYIGFEVGNHFVVGCGLDYKQGYRHLPYIGILKKGLIN